MERCRLVRYDEYSETLDQSFDYNEQVKGGTYCCLGVGNGGPFSWPRTRILVESVCVEQSLVQFM